MKTETLVLAAALGGVGYLLWQRSRPVQAAAAQAPAGAGHWQQSRQTVQTPSGAKSRFDPFSTLAGIAGSVIPLFGNNKAGAPAIDTYDLKDSSLVSFF